MVALITDDFNRANAATLGADWDDVGGTWQGRITSNQAVLERGAGDDIPAWRHVDALDSADHYAQFSHTTFLGGTSASVAGTCVRFDPAAKTFYLGWVRSGGSWVTGKVVSGTRTTLSSYTPSGAESTLPILSRLEVEGSTLRHIVKGVEVTSLTDTSITGHTKVGMHGHPGPIDEPFVDDFEAGVLGAVGPVGPFLRGPNGGVMRTASGIVRPA